MILTVTINPLLERRLTYKSINFNKDNRDGIKTFASGGKGINVSRQLNLLNIQNLAYTFAGGVNGKLLRDLLLSEKINSTFIKTKAETREAFILINEEKEKSITFFAENSEVLPEEVEEFKQKLEKMIENCEMVIFSGSSSCEEADSIFPFGIKIANKYDKISFCDTYGNHLRECIDSSPTIIHNNIEEIEKSLNISLKNEDEKLKFLDHLYSKNIKQAFLTDGENDFYVSNFDYHFKVKVPEIKAIDATGSGDAFTSGIIYGWHNDLTFKESLSFAAALGAINAQRFEVCNVKKEEAENLKEKVQILPVGKRIKTIDVTPI